jgi:hypothetical protein
MLAAIRRASSLVSIGSFAGGEGPCEATDPAAQARNCPLGSLAQIGLELAERHLDRVQVGRNRRCQMARHVSHQVARWSRLGHGELHPRGRRIARPPTIRQSLSKATHFLGRRYLVFLLSKRADWN